MTNSSQGLDLKSSLKPRSSSLEAEDLKKTPRLLSLTSLNYNSVCASSHLLLMESPVGLHPQGATSKPQETHIMLDGVELLKTG